MILLNFDKRGAEWCVVAYLSGDKNMLEVVKKGLDPHAQTGFYMTGLPVELIKKEAKIVGERTDPTEILELRRKHFPEMLKAKFIPRSMSVRQAGKKGNHGLNYDEHPNTFSIINEMMLDDARSVWKLYRTVAYPGVPEWHGSIREELRSNGRTLENLFGDKCYFMHAWGEDMFRQAYAFKPQSTIVRMVLLGMARVLNDGASFMAPLQALSQVHDSGVYQYERMNFLDMAACCIRVGLDHFSPWLEHKGERFQIATDLKVGRNWGNMIEVPLTRDVDALALKLEEAWEKLNTLRAVA